MDVSVVISTKNLCKGLVYCNKACIMRAPVLEFSRGCSIHVSPFLCLFAPRRGSAISSCPRRYFNLHSFGRCSNRTWRRDHRTDQRHLLQLFRRHTERHRERQCFHISERQYHQSPDIRFSEHAHWYFFHSG